MTEPALPPLQDRGRESAEYPVVAEPAVPPAVPQEETEFLNPLLIRAILRFAWPPCIHLLVVGFFFAFHLRFLVLFACSISS